MTATDTETRDWEVKMVERQWSSYITGPNKDWYLPAYNKIRVITKNTNQYSPALQRIVIVPVAKVLECKKLEVWNQQLTLGSLYIDIPSEAGITALLNIVGMAGVAWCIFSTIDIANYEMDKAYKQLMYDVDEAARDAKDSIVIYETKPNPQGGYKVEAAPL